MGIVAAAAAVTSSAPTDTLLNREQRAHLSVFSNLCSISLESRPGEEQSTGNGFTVCSRGFGAGREGTKKKALKTKILNIGDKPTCPCPGSLDETYLIYEVN